MPQDEEINIGSIFMNNELSISSFKIPMKKKKPLSPLRIKDIEPEVEIGEELSSNKSILGDSAQNGYENLEQLNKDFNLSEMLRMSDLKSKSGSFEEQKFDTQEEEWKGNMVELKAEVNST
jgi:hypothetical protein